MRAVFFLMSKQDNIPGPIGVFDSGYGGLTVFSEVLKEMPERDYIYLGDNARAPYGIRSLETVYQFTLEGVRFLFDQGCNLVILACNTASANALRDVQQRELPTQWSQKRVLGVIRPTTERMHEMSKTGHMGIFATEATVKSESYLREADKYAPGLTLHQQACPLWVPLIENDELGTKATEDITQRYVEALLKKNDQIDSVLLACTHYPILVKTIRKYLPDHIDIISQGEMVATALVDYLKRHPEMDAVCTKGESMRFFTTDEPSEFNEKASRFMKQEVKAELCKLEHE